MFKQGIDIKEFSEVLVKKVMYSSEITSNANDVSIVLRGRNTNDE